MAHLTALAFLALLGSFAISVAAQSGSGTTTRYWDCCKPSCAWSMSGITSPVKTCDISDKPLTDATAQSGCAGGTAYMCSDQSPFAINADLAYGFAAVSASSPNCCSCYQLTFTSTVLKGKKMIVQATNTGNDVGSTQFDLAIPGGGFGQFDGCSKEWKATSAVWGAQYGGPSTNTCSSFPTALQPGCSFRWGWMQGADNPTVDWQVVTCPAELVAKSGCSITGYKSADAPSEDPASSVAAADAPAPSSSPSTVPVSYPAAPVPAPSSANPAVSPPATDPKKATSNTTLAPIIVQSPSPQSSPPAQSGKAAPAHPHWDKQGHKHAAWNHTRQAGEEKGDEDCDA